MVDTHTSAAREARTSPRRPRVPVLVANVVRVSAVVTLGATLRPGLSDDLDAIDVLVPQGLLLAGTTISAGIQLVLARAIRLRKHRAWVLLLAITALGTLGHALTRSYGPLLVNAALCALLVVTRSDFTARSGPLSRWTEVRAFLLMAGASYIGGLLLVQRTAGRAPLHTQLSETFYGLVGYTPNLPFRRHTAMTLTTTTLAFLGLLTLLVTVLVLLQPHRATSRRGADDEVRLRALLDVHGCRDSLATSPCAATRSSCSHRPARRRLPTGSWVGSAWPAATRSVTQRPGRAPSRRGASTRHLRVRDRRARRWRAGS